MDLVGGKYRRTAIQTPFWSKKMSPKIEKSDGFTSVFLQGARIVWLSEMIMWDGLGDYVKWLFQILDDYFNFLIWLFHLYLIISFDYVVWL